MTHRTALAAIAVWLSTACSLWANFAATEIFIPAAGHVRGAAGTEFFTTVWISNPASTAADLDLQFLQTGQANATPLTVHDTLPAGPPAPTRTSPTRCST